MVPSISFMLLTSVAQSSHYMRPRSVLVGERDSEERERERMNGASLRVAKRGTDGDDVDVDAFKLQESEEEINNVSSKSNIHSEPAKKKKKKKKKKAEGRRLGDLPVFSCDIPLELHG
ncbi:hypothetical protein C4D60_Mb09t06030 [Musa balbisiana]|uniref:Uncharacterized protein n=1 Tax=Musa balbisiana TaxID=52838 RepID=A0A4S8IGS1_MUSBA|nr:hypothetical protein C4D60_Mb09t06030 [Musa balbisiana]